MYRFFSPLCLTETTELNPSLWPLCSRLSTTQNNISFCVGSSKQYQLCPDQVWCKVEMTVTKKINICVVIPPISINLKKGCVWLVALTRSRLWGLLSYSPAPVLTLASNSTSVPSLTPKPLEEDTTSGFLSTQVGLTFMSLSNHVAAVVCSQ